MGGSISKEPGTVIESGIIGSKDKSYITTVIQALYNIPSLKDYFSKKLYNENPNKHLSILFNKIVTKPLNKINFQEEGKNILQILRNEYKLNQANTPGEFLVQILLVLKYEEKNILNHNWEEYTLKTPQLLANLSDNKKALDDILDKNIIHFNTIFSAMFFGIFLAKRKMQNITNVLYFYNFYCVYELSIPEILKNMENKGKIKYNDEQTPNIHLIDCIKEMKETHIELFNKEQCYSEYYIYNTPNILIFLIKRDLENYSTFRGKIIFEENIDLTQNILFNQNNQSNKYKLISIISEYKYKDKEVVFSSDGKDYPFYKTVFRGENDNFYYYGKKNSTKKWDLTIDDENYFHDILIYMRY